MITTVFLPCHDPNGNVLLRFLECLPHLKGLFHSAYLSLSLPTRTTQSELSRQLLDEPFFTPYFPQNLPISSETVGEQFRLFYTWAVEQMTPDTLVHLAFPDRLAYALLSEYRTDFEKDIRRLRSVDTPLIFQRSEKAWETHPANYRQLEIAVTRAGEWLLGKSLDFAWCHLVVQAGVLKGALARTRQWDWSFVAELVLLLGPGVKTQSVDWLAWEDPFILDKDPDILRQTRQDDLAETRFRMTYVASMLELLAKYEEVQS
jgi:hypothetical protein